MTETFDGSERSIVDALRAEATHVAPVEARERVAARLSTRIGVVGLVASATVTAGSASAAASGVTVASALSVVALSKLLVLGMALGASTGLGLHFVGQRAVAPASTAIVPEASVPAVEPRTGVTPSPRAPVAPVAPLAAELESKPSAPRATAPARELPTAIHPTPELPVASEPTLSDGLAAQQSLLDDARLALRRGDGEQALRAVEAHRARFPRTAFEEERRSVAIRAELLLGHVNAAREQARAFAESHPKSLLLPSLVGELEKAGLTNAETESGAAPQSTFVREDAL